MKAIPENIKIKLQNYLDGKLTSVEASEIEKLISQDENIKLSFDNLRTIDAYLKKQKLVEPSKNFTERVMEGLDSYAAGRSFSLRNGIFLLVGVLVLTGLASVLISLGVFDTANSLNLNNLVSTNYIKKDLPTIPFNGKLIMNVLIMINLAIAFIVLDKAVLKPWFERRMHV
ncbi:MAG: hypothetical protein L0Y35_04175 [Flammeovirgaceae bacterium]|nr:hypothetical protein [Flammeovirgaceae bacterium]